MRITVIGCGRWGSLIAWYLDRTGHAVTLYGRPGSRHMQRFPAATTCWSCRKASGCPRTCPASGRRRSW